MIYRKQLSAHIPQAGIVGDCLRTCIACLLDKEPQDVPHFWQIAWDSGIRNEYESPEEQKFIRDWLAEQGYVRVDLPYIISSQEELHEVTLGLEKRCGRILYMVSGAGGSQGQHVVIYKGADLLWDPSPNSEGLSGPGIDGVYWFTFLMPISMRWDGKLPEE